MPTSAPNAMLERGCPIPRTISRPRPSLLFLLPPLHPNLLVLLQLQVINLHPHTHDPVVPLRAAPTLEHNTPSRHAQPTDLPQLLSRAAVLLLAHHSLEKRLAQPVPHHETRHRIFVRTRPPVFEVDSWQRVHPGMVRVKRLVLVQQVIFRNQARIDIAVLQVNNLLALVLDMLHLLPRYLAYGCMEDEQLSAGEDDAASPERRVPSRLAIQQ